MTAHLFQIVDQINHCDQIVIAELVFEQSLSHGVIRSEFRYVSNYLNLPDAVSIDPVNLPLSSQVFQFEGLPGVIEDILPDRWGREVAFKVDGIQRNDINKLIQWISAHHIGSLSFCLRNEVPMRRDIGPDIQYLEMLDKESHKFELKADPDINQQLRVHLGSGASVGGARRKTLISIDGVGYLAKFNQTNDPVDVPTVEHACMTMASLAGIETAKTQLIKSRGKNVLLVERFDIVEGIPCRQLLSFNSLLKGTASQYSELAHVLIQQVSTKYLKQSLFQLFQQMCFNYCINNTDDHLRNFSLLRSGQSWRTTPAYDLVPSTFIGEYHQLGFNYSLKLPKGEKLLAFAKSAFHLNREEVSGFIERLNQTLINWQTVFSESGVSEQDISYLQNVIRTKIET